MKNSPSLVLLPEKMCLLWGGFIGFTIAFAARLLASGNPSDALFSGVLACLAGGLLGKVLGQYLNANLKAEPTADAARNAPEGTKPKQAQA